MRIFFVFLKFCKESLKKCVKQTVNIIVLLKILSYSQREVVLKLLERLDCSVPRKLLKRQTVFSEVVLTYYILFSVDILWKTQTQKFPTAAK